VDSKKCLYKSIKFQINPVISEIDINETYYFKLFLDTDVNRQYNDKYANPNQYDFIDDRDIYLEFSMIN